MVQLADIQPGDRVLEPSAGTGAIIAAMGGRMFGHNPDRGELMAVEINDKLAQHLEREFPLTNVATADFLECGTYNLGKFDAIVMNPPFGAASDIKHIKHAMGFLKPGGRLVAICAHGPRQVDQLQALAVEHGGTWEKLPDGTFQDAGTNVSTALLTLTLPKDELEEYPEIEEAPEEAPELEEQAPAFQLVAPEPMIQRTPAGLQYMLFSLAAN
jgi:tRNA G10  N-methylase Trm11